MVRSDSNGSTPRRSGSPGTTTPPWYYDIYRRNRPNALKVKNMTWLGRISSDCYYVNNLQRLNFEKSAVIQLYPIAIDGTNKPTASSTVKLNWI